MLVYLARKLQLFLTIIGDDDEPEWMREFARRESRRAVTEKRNELETRLARTKEEEERQRRSLENAERPRKKQVCDIPVYHSLRRSLINRYGRNLTRQKQS